MDIAKSMKDCGLYNYSSVFTFPNHSKFVLICGEDNKKFSIDLSDGDKLWTIQLSADIGLVDLQQQIKMADVTGIFKWIKRCLDTADLEISIDIASTEAVLSLGKKPRPVGKLRLVESSAGVRDVVFRLANLTGQLRRDVATLEGSVDRLERQSIQGGAGLGVSVGSKQDERRSNKQVKAGMSRVNPSNRRRKVAKGVVFGVVEDDD